MKCPKCNSNISDKKIAKYLAAKGGKKSRRSLTREQALAMVAAKKRSNKNVAPP